MYQQTMWRAKVLILFYNKIHLQKNVCIIYLIFIKYILGFYEVRQCFVSVTSGVSFIDLHNVVLTYFKVTAATI